MKPPVNLPTDMQRETHLTEWRNLLLVFNTLLLDGGSTLNVVITLPTCKFLHSEFQTAS